MDREMPEAILANEALSCLILQPAHHHIPSPLPCKQRANPPENKVRW
jgi:hypothetical protein